VAQKPRGLKSIQDAREQRKHRTRASLTFWVYALAGIAVATVAYRLVTRSQLNSRKEDMFGARSSLESGVGREWNALSAKLERFTLEEAGDYRGDLMDKSVAGWDFRSLAGIYLRVRAAEAKTVETLRRAGEDSARDGFTSCLLRPTVGGSQAMDAGAIQDRPWNLRQGYAATRVLTPEWKALASEASDDHRLRVFEEQYDKATKQDIPLAVEMLKEAEFFLLVLDEDVDAGRDQDGGAITEESLQLVKHPARVTLFNLKSGVPVFRTRKASEGGYRLSSEHAMTDPAIRDAMKRQVNNCALANDVNNALADDRPAGHGDAGTSK